MHTILCLFCILILVYTTHHNNISYTKCIYILLYVTGDEGGFAPPIQSNKEGVVLLMEAIEKAGHLNKIILGTLYTCTITEIYDDNSMRILLQ